MCRQRQAPAACNSDELLHAQGCALDDVPVETQTRIRARQSVGARVLFSVHTAHVGVHTLKFSFCAQFICAAGRIMSAVPMRFRPASEQGATPLRGILEHNPGDLKQTAKSSAGTCRVCARMCKPRMLIFMSAALIGNIHPGRTRDSSYVPHTCK